MEYTKTPLTIPQQIEKLKYRGLLFNNEVLAAKYLSNISYYRLRAYTFPFQNNVDDEDDHHFFRKDIQFNDIIDLYCFDRRLRSLIFNAIEKIEVAVRTKIISEYALSTNDSHWFLNKELYFRTEKYDYIIDDIEEEIDRSTEDFIKHYKMKYDEPDFPPSWMTLEVLSFGTLSRLYSYLDKKSDKNKRIAQAFGLPNSDIFENWIHAISILRNFCAHHSRTWNRRFSVSVKLSYNTTYPFMDRETIKTVRDNKLFAILSCIKYILDIISPDSDFKKNLIVIMDDGGRLVKLKDMGFPENWVYLDVWKDK